MAEREDVAALARELHEWFCMDEDDAPAEPDWHAAESCHAFAFTVASSDWLAAHDERARADERERLAGEAGA